MLLARSSRFTGVQHAGVCASKALTWSTCPWWVPCSTYISSVIQRKRGKGWNEDKKKWRQLNLTNFARGKEEWCNAETIYRVISSPLMKTIGGPSIFCLLFWKHSPWYKKPKRKQEDQKKMWRVEICWEFSEKNDRISIYCSAVLYTPLQPCLHPCSSAWS